MPQQNEAVAPQHEAVQGRPTLGDLVYTFMINAGMDLDPVASYAKQQNQLSEEFNELRAALDARDVVEIWDGIGDVLFVISSLEILSNMQPDLSEADTVKFRQKYADLAVLMTQHELPVFLCEVAATIAAESNLTKFDDTFEAASATQAAYLADHGINTTIQLVEATNAYTVVADGDQQTETMSVHDGKVLKSIEGFRAPDFSKLAAEHTPTYVLAPYL